MLFVYDDHGGPSYSFSWMVLDTPCQFASSHVTQSFDEWMSLQCCIFCLNDSVIQYNSVKMSSFKNAAIMGTGDGSSVKDPVATYLFVISISQTEVKPTVKGSGFLPPTAQQVCGSLFEMSWSGSTRVLAGLCWIQNLLHQNPNHTGSNSPPLLIPIDNEGMVKDVHHTIGDQTPTFDLINPDFEEILQATCSNTILNELPIWTNIAHVKRHKDQRTKLWLAWTRPY
jgi:hypothetical protein